MSGIYSPVSYPNYFTIVVDNGSNDDSLARIKAWTQANLGERHALVEYSRTMALAGGNDIVEKTIESASPKDRIVNQE